MASRITPRDRELQQPSSDFILRNVADPKEDIKAERSKATCKVTDLSVFLYDSLENVERRRFLVGLVKEKKELSKDDVYFLTRTEKYVRGLGFMPAIQALIMEHGLSRDDAEFLFKMVDQHSALDLHFAMFIPTLLGQGTKDQVQSWVMPSFMREIIGNYAQTELGHGTYLRGLETTATYDKSTQEFILHSPTPTALKWWPGGLGKTSTHSVVVARLFIDGKDFGPAPFFVPIRDPDTHMALPGVTVGDIGPKVGFHAVDNGFLGFDHFRIPRNYMLMKNLQVTPEGQFIPPKAEKAAYGTMVMIRAQLVSGASIAMAKAATIAVRYSAVRRQTAQVDGELETQVLDYQNQMYSLFPIVSMAYAFHCTGKMMWSMYKKFNDQLETGDFGTLPEMHAISSGLKAICTWGTADAIEKCRKLCGGHGFSLFSGLPSLFNEYVGAVTYEGENNVMCLQASRYLVKAWGAAKSHQRLTGHLEYLNSWSAEQKCAAKTSACFLDSTVQLAAFSHRSATAIANAVACLNAEIKSGKTEAAARDAVGSDLIIAARAHCMYVILHTFTEAVNGAENPSIKPVLARLRDLFALYEIEQTSGEFLYGGYMSSKQLDDVRKQVRLLLIQLRPDAVTLVDAFDYDDYFLNSALGRYDGDVYNTMIEWAKREPLNQTAVGPGYEEFIKPFLKAHL